MDFETKRGPASSLKATDELGTFAGHGAMFNEFHPTSSWALPMDWKDTIRPGAFKESLAEWKGKGRLPALVYQHDLDRPIGRYTAMEEDREGLALKGKLTIDATDGRDAWALMKDGAIDGLSIGFRVTKQALDEKKKLREILSVNLIEVSPVTIPAIDSARITDVKSAIERRAMTVADAAAMAAQIGKLHGQCGACDNCDERDDMLAGLDALVGMMGAGSADAGKSAPKTKRFLEAVLRDAGLSRDEAKALLAEGFTALRDAAADDDERGRDARVVAGDDVLVSLRRLAQSINPR